MSLEEQPQATNENTVLAETLLPVLRDLEQRIQWCHTGICDLQKPGDNSVGFNFVVICYTAIENEYKITS